MTRRGEAGRSPQAAAGPLSRQPLLRVRYHSTNTMSRVSGWDLRDLFRKEFDELFSFLHIFPKKSI